MKSFKFSAILIMATIVASLSACSSNDVKLPEPVPTISAFDNSSLPSSSLVAPLWVYTDDFRKTNSAAFTLPLNSILIIANSDDGKGLTGEWVIESSDPSIAKISNDSPNAEKSSSTRSITPILAGKATVTLENQDTNKHIKLTITVVKAK